MQSVNIQEMLTLAENLEINNKYIGKIELYFMRYGKKTIPANDNEGKKIVPNAVFYEAEVGQEVQKELLDIFINNIRGYISKSRNIEPYNVVSKEKEVLASLGTNKFENVKNLMLRIKNKEGFITSLAKLNLNSVNCFCAQVKLTEEKKVFFFGKIDKFTNLKTGFFANISDSEVKRLEVDKLFGFVNFISFFEYSDELLIDSQDNFDSAFKMKEFFLQESLPVLDTIGELGKVSTEDITKLKELCMKDSRVAKRFMKLGTDSEGITQFFNNLDDSSFETIYDDPVFSVEFNLLSFVDGKITSTDSKTDTYYKQLARFIRDTANRGVISNKSKVLD